MSAEACFTDAAADLRNTHSRPPELHDQRQRSLMNHPNFCSLQKPYVVELEQKIRAYEQASVGATKCVQAAARVVAAENASLRDLTRMQLGWNEQELDRFISLGMYHKQTRTLDATDGIGYYCHCQRGPRCLGNACRQQQVASAHSLPLVENMTDQNKNGPNEFTT